MRILSTTAAVAALTLVAACGDTASSTGTTTAAAGSASGLPAVAVTCPGGISVNASQHGPVYINGSEAQLTTFSDTYWEASGGGITASISRNPDGTGSVSYTGSGGANGICT
jgi:hypothetical protein